MATLGGKLKRHEKLSGRMADALAWMYLGSATVKRFVDEGQTARTCRSCAGAWTHALSRLEEALVGMLDNLPNRPAAWLLRRLILPFGAGTAPPTIAWERGRAHACWRTRRRATG